MSDKLDFNYDPLRDLLVINGVTYSGELFRTVGLVPPTQNQVLRILKNDDGLVTIKSYRVDMDEFEKWQAERYA